ncbi:EF-hand domain-containing protein [Nonomuraea rubra]|uniref:EF-hand domain-containing protein n=1 Tax=Nonomuraea rubra TaxID=46180 RepID=UPI0033EB10B4
MPTAGTDPLRKLFTLLDADRDGHLRSADYQRLVDRILRHYQLDDDDHEAILLRAAYARYWRELLGDDVERVNDETFFAAHCLVTPGPVFQALNGIVHAVLTIARTGYENTINKEEFNRLMSVLGVTGPAAAAAFSWLDSDADGKVGCAEFIRAAEGYFLAEDHTAPGAVLFGMYDPAPPIS